MQKLLPALALALLLILAACSSGDDGGGETPADDGVASPDCYAKAVNEPIEDEILPIVISSDLAVGENRFVIGLIEQKTEEALTDATVHLEFLCFDTPEGTPAFEADAEAITLTRSFTHTHEDGTVESHEAGDTGAYVAYVDFDRPGGWGVVVTGTTADDREFGPTRPQFGVSEEAFSLAVGDPAPMSVQPTINDGIELRSLDTSEIPNPAQHDMTVADAVTSGRPTVIAFTTPAFCQSQICGPIKGVFDDLNAAYEGQANFVHIEPYDVEKMRRGECPSLADCLVPTVDEWELRSEPWVYIVDSDGNIAASFDGIASYEEMDAALQETLNS